MTTLVIIQLILALALVVLVLLQGSDNDSLGLGGGTSTGMMSARGTANLLSRLTAITAGLFMVCLLYTSPSPRDPIGSRMPSSA